MSMPPFLSFASMSIHSSSLRKSFPLLPTISHKAFAPYPKPHLFNDNSMNCFNSSSILLSISPFSSSSTSSSPHAHPPSTKKEKEILTPFPPTLPITLHVGDYISTTRSFLSSNVNLYANLINDHNSIHMESPPPDSPPNPFGRPIVHGMLTSSIFSSLFSHYFPGSIYLSQSIIFHSPVFFDQMIRGVVRIKAMDKADKGIVMCETAVEVVGEKNKDGKQKLAVTGEAMVMIKNLKQRIDRGKRMAKSEQKEKEKNDEVK